MEIQEFSTTLWWHPSQPQCTRDQYRRCPNFCAVACAHVSERLARRNL